MRFIIHGNADLISCELEKFIDEAQEVYDQQAEIAKQRIESKLSYLPIHGKIDLPPLILTYVKKDSTTVIFDNPMMGGIVGRMQSLILSRAVKKMVQNLEGYFKVKGIDVRIEVEK